MVCAVVFPVQSYDAKPSLPEHLRAPPKAGKFKIYSNKRISYGERLHNADQKEWLAFKRDDRYAANLLTEKACLSSSPGKVGAF